MRSLLDINVLLALFDRDHVHHADAWRWFAREVHHGWASCAITQNGFVRILSQPRYPSPVSVAKAMSLLRAATTARRHEYWESGISILDESLFDHSRIHGPRQLTDVYLLGLAVHHGGRLVTLDQGVALAAVRDSRHRNLVVL